MRPNGNIRNNELFRHRTLISADRIFDADFTHDGSRSVQLLIQGQILNVSESIVTIPIGTENISTLQRIHSLTVFGLDPEQESLTRSSVIDALREYDEASHRQAILIAMSNERVRRCSLHPPRRFS